MHKRIYNTARWRDLPRDYCAVELLLGEAAGPCAGLIAHHHVVPDDPDSRTLQICAAHHPKLHAVLRRLEPRPWRTCPHRHPYPEGRLSCERRLNEVAA